MGKVSDLLQASLMVSDFSQDLGKGLRHEEEWAGSGCPSASGCEKPLGAPGWDFPRMGSSLEGGLTPWSQLHRLLFWAVESLPQLMFFVGSSMGMMLD